MNKIKMLTIIIAILNLVSISEAALVDNQVGTITQIRDDGSRLMWLKDANYAQTSGYSSDGRMNWNSAMTWASGLSFGGYNDWRLPVASEGRFEFGYNGATTAGYNITSSELGYMFYAELGNLGWYDIAGNPLAPSSYGLKSKGPFTNLYEFYYLTSTVHAHSGEPGSGPDQIWDFICYNGLQQLYSKQNVGYAWAVRDMAPVPIPTAIWFLGSGLIGLAGLKILKRGV